MSIRNRRIFGLAVPLSLADVPNTNQALLNIGLNIKDLDVIRGISESGFDSNDLQTLSNLDTPIWKTFDRYVNDVRTYSNTLTISSGSDFRSRGNIEVVGPISASAFRYTLLDTFSSTPVLRWGDISTSRVSSWSSLGNAISYGSDVKIAGKVTAGKIKTRVIPTTRTFASEIPTHKIKLRLNGVDRFFYVMKGIPIQFRGFFRDFDSTIEFVNTGVRNSWRVYNINGTAVQDFADVGSFTSSTLNYRSPFSSEKFIEIYTNPANITRISLNNCNIQQIPRSRVTGLLRFDFSTNGLVEFPDLTFFGPNLRVATLTNNPFFNSADVDLRYFSQKVASRIPVTIQELSINGCFKGSFVQNTLNRFSSLRFINANRSTFNTTSFFYPDSKNPTGVFPNFYGIAGQSISQVIQNINFNNNDFRQISSGVQGGVERVSLSSADGGSGGSGYNNGNDGLIANVSLTNVSSTGSGAIANLTIIAGVVTNIEIVNPGLGYAVGNILSASLPSGSGLLIAVTSAIFVLSVKEQGNLTNLDLGNNSLLADSGFSLAASTTLVNVNTDNTRLAIANCSNFTALESYNNTRNIGRGSLWSGWDGVFGSPGYPRTDIQNFKFANCRNLRTHNNNESDVRGYLPKYVGCTELRSYNFWATNNIVAGRPGKRRILELFQRGGISQLGSFVIASGTGAYTFNKTDDYSDTGENASASVTRLAVIRVTTDASGNVVSYSVISAGTGYTTSDKVTISGLDLGSSTPTRNLIIDITSVESAYIQGNTGNSTYTPGTYLATDIGGNTQFGIFGRVLIEIGSDGNVGSYSLDFGGQDYQNNEFITIAGSVLGAGANDNLRIKIARAEAPKILYNDQFTDNPNVSTINININNSQFAGEIESGSLTPLKDSLVFFRLLAARRIQGNFPDLEDATKLEIVYSENQGWTGRIPTFNQAFNLREVYLFSNRFDGSFEYVNKGRLDYVNFNSNLIENISNVSRLPVCRFFYFANNQLTGILPTLDEIIPNAQFIQLNGNRYDNYSKGVASLLRIRSLDLSLNRIPTPSIDNILFDLVKNYNSAPRSGVLINLQGAQMGAPTPYPITGGIITSLQIISQPVVSGGSVTNLGSVTGVSSTSVPVAGTYTNLGLSGSSGTGASCNVTVSVTAVDNVVKTINSTPSFTGVIGEIQSLGSFTYSGDPTIEPSTVTNIPADGDGFIDAFDTGALSRGNTSGRVRIFIQSGVPTSLQLLNGGSNYSRQGTADRISIDTSTFGGNQDIVINLQTVAEFTNGTYVLTDTRANTQNGTGASLTIVISGGLITSASLRPLPAGGGSGYQIGERITISGSSVGWTLSNLTFEITDIFEKYYTAASYAVVINSGGSNYSINDELVTSPGISFRRPNGTIELGSLRIRVANVTSQVNRSVFTGFAAVEFLRSKGWTMQVSS